MNVSHWLNKIHTLLAPQVEVCLTCNRPIHRQQGADYRQYDPLLQRSPGSSLASQLHRSSWLARPTEHPFITLCDACLRQMAWIRTIRCPICGRATGCPDCTRRGPEMTFFQYNRSSVQYSPAMREWLAQYKYRGNERYLAVLGRMAMFAYLQVLQQQCMTQQTPRIDVITFVPVSETRLEERGFNQAEQLAQTIAQYAHVPIRSLLQRNRHTIKQSMKSRGDRIEDMKDVFSPDPNAIQQLHTLIDRRDTKHSVPHPLRILLVDDVYTTGSTINACAQQLRSGLDPFHKVEIYSLTWARS